MVFSLMNLRKRSDFLDIDGMENSYLGTLLLFCQICVWCVSQAPLKRLPKKMSEVIIFEVTFSWEVLSAQWPNNWRVVFLTFIGTAAQTTTNNNNNNTNCNCKAKGTDHLFFRGKISTSA